MSGVCVCVSVVKVWSYGIHISLARCFYLGTNRSLCVRIRKGHPAHNIKLSVEKVDGKIHDEIDAIKYKVGIVVEWRCGGGGFKSVVRVFCC